MRLLRWILVCALIPAACSDHNRAATTALQSNDKTAATRAIWTIAAQGSHGAWAIPALEAALDDDELRPTATWALAEIGPAAATAHTKIIAGLNHESGSVRAASAWAIGRVGLAGDEVREALRVLTKDSDLLARKAATTVLARMN